MDLSNDDVRRLLSEHGSLIAISTTAFVLIVSLIAWLVDSSPSAVAFDVQVPEQCKDGWKGEVLDSPTLKVSGSTAVQCYCPASGQSLGLVNPATAEGVNRVVAKAEKAQRTWARTTFEQRRQVLKSLLQYVLQHQDDIAKAACLDSGKTKVDALFGEILVTAEKLKWTIDHGEKALKAESRPTNFLMMYKKNEVRYEPLGVVAACVSWNYPFHNLISPVISALFTGNAIIVKNSEQTAWSSAYFTDIIRTALSANGHSKYLVHAITCWPNTANVLTSHPDLSHITFIGSRPVAHHVCASAAKALTPVTVELGGKDAFIILGENISTGEMNRISSMVMRGVFQSAGQNCIGIERVVATKEAYARLIDLLIPRIRALKVGNALEEDNIDVGAMISAASFQRMENLVSEAVSQGAQLLHGGKRYNHPQYPQGHYFTPTLLTNVSPKMRIAQQEVFGPICVLMRAENVDDAISIANDPTYGLGCSVFGPVTTASNRADLAKVTKEVQAGMIAVNDFAAYYAVQLPFGGTKGSGYGRFAGEEGLRALCNVKSVCRDRWPAFVKTSIPGGLDYPMKERAWEMGKGVVELGYGDGAMGKFRGLRKVIGF